MALFLFIVLVCLVAGLLGAVIKGLLWLLAIAIAVFLVNMVLAGYRIRGRSRARS